MQQNKDKLSGSGNRLKPKVWVQLENHILLLIVGVFHILQYLLSDLDVQDEDDDKEQLVKNADSSDDDVDDLECKVTDVAQIQRQIVRQ